MYYDTYRGKRSRGRASHSCLGWLFRKLLKLILLLVVLALIAAVLLYALPVSFLNVEPSGVELSLTDGLPGNKINILLMGLDASNEGMQRSDAIMIASVGFDGVKLTSLMRDTMVEIPGQGRHKLNSAHALGGPELVMRVINETFELNITNYIAVDFRALVDLVDAVGGVTVNLEENELDNLNKNAYNTFKTISQLDAQRYAHYATSSPETRTGSVKLNGLFATAYARIRKTDSDYMRTSRQREVLSGLLERMRECFWNPMMYLRLYEVYSQSVQTNLTLPELISLGEKALVAGMVENLRIPDDGHLQDDGSAITITDLQGCVETLHQFIYG